MRIPFGPRQPNEKERELLVKLGFDLVGMELIGRYYFLNTPESTRISCQKSTPDIDMVVYEIKYNEVPVISIKQKIAMTENYVFFDILASSVEVALAKNAELTEEADEAIANSAKPVLAEDQEKLADHLRQLVGIIVESGSSRDYGSTIGEQCQYLSKLKAENPAKYNELISNTTGYQKLLGMFPERINTKNVQAKDKRMDVAPLAAMSAGSEEDSRSKCSMM